MTPNYADKSFLIVDDFSEFRRSVKAIVQQLGALDVDMCGTGEEAVEMCGNKRYDIILSDYNLGDGKDGQQVLEELIHLKRLKAGALFLMITAENTQAMVMGALEYQPDAYITKPFNKAALKARLDKLMEKKIATEGIDLAVEKNNLAEAIRLCDEEIRNQGKYALSCLRTKAQLLEQRGDHEAAAGIYRSASRERPLPWALVGLGRTLLAMGKAEEAKKVFEDTAKQLPMLLAAHDGLARALVKLGDTRRAQEVLTHATRVSPKAILRQIQLGEVAERNGDHAIAARAFRHAVSLGRNSVYKSADNYLHLATNLTAAVGGGSPVEDKRLAEEIGRALNEVETAYEANPLVELRSTLVQAAMAKRLKKDSDAAALTKRAQDQYEQLDSAMTPDVAAEAASAFRALGDNARADDIARRCAEMYGNTTGQHQELATENDPDTDRALEQNAAGIDAFRAQDFETALKCFREAVRLAPRNISIVLNSVQALIEVARRHDNDSKLLAEAKRWLDVVSNMPADDKRYVKYQQLQRLLTQLAGARS